MANAIQVNSASGFGTALACAFLSNVTSGNLCVAGAHGNANDSSVTDSVDTLNTAVVRDDAGNSMYGEIHYVENATSGAHTITRNQGTSADQALAIGEYSGVAGTSRLDVTDSDLSYGTSANSTATATTAQANELLIGVSIYESAGDPPTASGGFVSDKEVAGGRPVFLASKVVTSVGSYANTATLSADCLWICLIATFKGAAPPEPTIALTGTATASIDEADIVAGGKTIILTVTDDTIVSNTVIPPVIEAGDCTVSGSNTAADPWSTVAHPNASTGDLLIFYIAWDDSTTTTSVVAPAGPNSETLTEINATPITDSSTETQAQAWYTVATGAWTAGNLSFNPSAIESWSATCVRIPAGEFDAADPIGAVGTSASTVATDTTVDSPAFSAGATDGDGALLWFASVDADPLSATNPTGWTILQTQDLGAVAHGVARRNAAVTDSESIASATWAIAGDSWTSIAVIVRAPSTTLFSAARTAIRDGLDSAQAGASGWDAKVKPNIPLANIVRTSDTVITVTLQAQTDYDVTAQETIEATVPASALAGGTLVVATPTFTVDTAGAAAYTLACASGSYAITGTAATLKRAAKVDATTTSYAVTGTATSLEHSFKLTADPGSVALTGTAATLSRAAKVASDAGSYAITGTAASFEHSYTLAADSGSVAVTGVDATLRRAAKATVDSGIYAITGTDTTFEHSYTLSSDPGSVVVTGTDADLTKSGALNAYTLSCEIGSFTLTGTAATLKLAAKVASDAGSYAFTGTDATLQRAAKVASDPGSVVIGGTTADLLRAFTLPAASDAYVITGTDATLTKVTGYSISAEVGSFGITGIAARATFDLFPVASVSAGFPMILND